MPFSNDRILHYGNGEFGALGYAVPNLSRNNLVTFNGSIQMLVDAMGRNLHAIMHRTDADLRTPPKIGTLMSIHKLIVRSKAILAGRTSEHNEPEFAGTHATPPAKDFILYPTPYFHVQNRWMKEWAEMVMYAISEAAQHTDNRREYELTPEFSGVVGQYLQRIYRLMATELFGKTKQEASAPDFELTDSDFNMYDPTRFFTLTELVDHPRLPTTIPTEDDLRVLSAGIKAVDIMPFVYADAVPEPDTGEVVDDDAVDATNNSGAIPFRQPPV